MSFNPDLLFKRLPDVVITERMFDADTGTVNGLTFDVRWLHPALVVGVAVWCRPLTPQQTPDDGTWTAQALSYDQATGAWRVLTGQDLFTSKPLPDGVEFDGSLADGIRFTLSITPHSTLAANMIAAVTLAPKDLADAERCPAALRWVMERVKVAPPAQPTQVDPIE